MVSSCYGLKAFYWITQLLPRIHSSWLPKFDSSWYNLIPVLSSVTESIVLSMYVDYKTLLDPIGSVCLFFGMLSGDKLCSKWWRINAKNILVELENVWLVLRLGSKFLHNILWYFQSSGWIPILKYISAVTQTQAAGCLLNHMILLQFSILMDSIKWRSIEFCRSIKTNSYCSCWFIRS